MAEKLEYCKSIEGATKRGGTSGGDKGEGHDF